MRFCMTIHRRSSCKWRPIEACDRCFEVVCIFVHDLVYELIIVQLAHWIDMRNGWHQLPAIWRVNEGKKEGTLGVKKKQLIRRAKIRLTPK